MAMTKEEREKLEKLPASDLVDMLDKMRDENEKNSKKAVEERAKIMREFFDGGKNNEPDEDEEDADGWKNSEAFKRLKRKFA